MEAAFYSFDSEALPAAEESELLSQLLGAYPFLNEQEESQSFDIQSMFWPESSHSYDGNPSTYYWTHDSSISGSTSSFFTPTIDYSESYFGKSKFVAPGTNDGDNLSMGTAQTHLVIPSSSYVDLVSMNEETSSEELGDLCMNTQQHSVVEEQKQQAKRKSNECNVYTSGENPKKKVHRNTKNATSKKSQKCIKNCGEDESQKVRNGQSSCCYSSEDDSNSSIDLSRGGGGASSCSKGSVSTAQRNGKTRASRGSATDPQSLYARKRRERINERLRILQGLVPNGTKVDISTMLEEAVQYVKFLQVQIKLLSSDDLWMYAPIAYNGMNIGLDLMMAQAKQ